ncbi:CcoQ/FixQ family Cbb3-type cytochrome c oxidase assembly chaperone [Rubrivivax gelatinosus]|uniref:CcoQ/FixQ family Cbb3-type cytochrome c oxidase assembly chaperone n=1 Tax=Rubrivivax gelatinosus TaxID=28068 RepID=A0ABS1DYS5_RUBGE|nr:CcoQ/FixQ family Cbb3-type cytochrome c oxidase assembly chaperone [Rubrivivax gelatinosus]MBK1616181.1 CcoQ/FixQ family Cbb3-type cytochrome c oxidase assembly chaperone [Rubrivivax gelatinosus]MBK1713867.1 CcoQ/FixQ family Cbb3-type cytochrome c oxidase assembly chaperone [Rubrivivax gelatinosus]
MDINTLRTIVTVVSFALFIGILVWTWSRRRRAHFDEAAMLPFLEKDGVETAGERK